MYARKVVIKMEEQRSPSNRPVNPRRRKRTKMQIFKEAYLPVIIAGLALVLILVFIIGSISRAIQRKNDQKAASIAASSSIAEEEARLEQEIQDLFAQAEIMVKDYDYPGAIALLNSFSGDISKYPHLNDRILEYEAAFDKMVLWNDPSKVVNLSFQLLLADPARGYSFPGYGYSINRNFITTTEFSKILQQLYDNGYILVSLDDIITTETTASGNTVYKPKPLYLPNGKKPIMFTQTNVNYNYYLIDSNKDKLPDANGGGFASKLLWNGSKFTCEMVDASGNTVTGDYDMVPILDAFVEKHPDFSYRGAKAILALTGYNGLFGYRTHESAIDLFGESAYRQAIQDATTVANALRNNGYTLACYTYENIPSGQSSLNTVKNDLKSWTDEVVPILGNIDILVYAQLNDIATPDKTYSGEKFDTLHNLGFRYYLGFCENGTPFATLTENYIRQGRILVTGSNLAHNSDWFNNLFDPSSVLDASRGNIPE